ncbi:MAG: CRISPR-associated endonuclease Cas2 [Candidatus Spechtbacterales bacterium]
MPKKKTYPQRQMGKHEIIAKRILMALVTPLVIVATPFSTTPRYAKDLEEALDNLEDFFFPGPENFNEEKIRGSIYNLKSGGYIKYRTSKDKTKLHFELTEKGKRLVQSYKLDELNLSQQSKWDGKWRFVMFDIPEKSRYARDILRDKLENLGFFRIQQSVWVYPYACEKEIDFLAEFLYIKACVLIFTGKVNKDEELKVHFRKLGFNL